MVTQDSSLIRIILAGRTGAGKTTLVRFVERQVT